MNSNTESGIIYTENATRKYTSWDNQNKKSVKMKLMYDIVKEVIENTKEQLSSNTYKKMRRMFLMNEAIKSQNSSHNLQNSYEEILFLEPTHVAKWKLIEVEKIEIRSFMETQLRHKINNFISRYEELECNSKGALRTRDSIPSKICPLSNELMLLNWKSKIDEIHIGYEKHLNIIFKLLNDWNECKAQLCEARSKSTNNILIQAQLIEIQIIISKLSCQIRMFLESPASINAFKILKSKLNFTVQQLSSEIQKKANLKNEYESLQCAEYDEILKKYIDVSDAVEKKKNFFNGL